MGLGPNEKVRIGIIGCGGIANGKHMPSLAKLNNVEMVAFCDIVVERAEAAKAKYGTPDAAVYADYKELLKDTTIDVVHVCTPNRSHSFMSSPAQKVLTNQSLLACSRLGIGLCAWLYSTARK